MPSFSRRSDLRAKGKAILMSTHDIFRARDVADRVGIMKEGRKVMERTREELEFEDLERLYLDYMRGGVGAAAEPEEASTEAKPRRLASGGRTGLRIDEPRTCHRSPSMIWIIAHKEIRENILSLRFTLLLVVAAIFIPSSLYTNYSAYLRRLA